MPPSDAPRRAAAHRLHPVSLVFTLGAAAKSLLIPAVLVLLASRASFMQFAFMLLFFLVSAFALIRYFTYRYRLEDDELVIRQGVVTRSERNIPYARIQNIDLVQNPLHRVFGVAEVRLETAAGDEPEAVMRVLALDAVETLRAHVFVGRGSDRGTVEQTAGPGAGEAAPSESPASELHTMTPRDLFLFGVISNKGMVVVAAALGILWQFDLWERIESYLSPETFKQLQEIPRPTGPFALVFFGVGVLVAALIMMRVLSIVWAFVKFHGFVLRRCGDDLRIEHGLFTRVSKTIPRRRIQLVSTSHGLLHRWFGRCAMRVETAGGSEGGDGSSADRLWLAPLLRAADVDTLLRNALPGVSLAGIDWRPIHPRAERRLLRRTLYVLVPLGLVSAVGVGVWTLLPVALLAALAWLNARNYVRHAAWAETSHAVFYRSGWWIRQMSVVPYDRIQSVERTESPFDRRQGMAALQVDTAGGGRVGHAVHVSYLEAKVASGLLERLTAEAGRTAYRW